MSFFEYLQEFNIRTCTVYIKMFIEVPSFRNLQTLLIIGITEARFFIHSKNLRSCVSLVVGYENDLHVYTEITGQIGPCHI